MVETMELPRKPLPEVAGFQAFLPGRIWGFANTQPASRARMEVRSLTPVFDGPTGVTRTRACQVHAV
jgi:hypothetical protein